MRSSSSVARLFLTSIIVLVGVSAWHWVAAQKPDDDAPAGATGKKPGAGQRRGNANPKAGRAALDQAALQVAFEGKWSLEDRALHRDFPAMALDDKGVAWIGYIEHDGKADVLKLARKMGKGIEPVGVVSKPGVVHQPAIAFDGKGSLWSVWGQVGDDDVVHLHARRYAGGKFDEAVTLAKSAGADTFADAGTDHAGRVWVVWQSLRRGQGDIFARWFDPATDKWSAEIQVSKPEGGNWEPRVAFDGKDGAWVVFDSSRGGEFNLYLAHVGLDGAVEEKQITSTADYEARASIIGDGGKGFWIAAERGHKRWGLALRGHESATGLNGAKRILFGYYEIATGRFSEVPLLDKGAPAARPQSAVNLPVVALDGEGNPWLAYRVFTARHWRIELLRFDAARKMWSQPAEVADSAFGQDRHAVLRRDGSTGLWLCWSADRRVEKECGVSAVFLAKIAAKVPPDAGPPGEIALEPELVPYLVAPSPERPRTEHHTWSIGGKTYRLCFGDLHRHTDFSNCRTPHDGCVLEHFRYAVDMAALDFVGTSDHTDIAKKYDPYEWWQTQRMVDVFHVPGTFSPLYAYEREQPYPWGHRNVVFAQRGGPIVYINRLLYHASPWNPLYPCPAGIGAITPMEVWDILRAYGKPVSVISHTGATGMGTDWDKYERIDHTVENTVEIFQGARVSYEGLNAPQPTVGLHAGQKYTADAASPANIPLPPSAIGDFGVQRNNGVYQHALARGHQLGVFASSDHISTHTSFGGVYVEDFTREGLIKAFNSRRTIAATDKIFLEFSCNGQPLGSVFEASDKPTLAIAVLGTNTIKRVTIVRNEKDFQIFEPNAREFTKTFTDETPLNGENRYYIRVEQADGNMAWSSPVWVTVRK